MHPFFSKLSDQKNRRRYRPEVLPLEDRVVPTVMPVFDTPFLETSLIGGDFGDFPTAVHATFLNVSDGKATAIGSIQDSGLDLDYFRIETTAPNQHLWVYVDTGGPAGAGSQSRDSVLTLLNHAGAPLETDDDDGTGNGGDGSVEEPERSSIIANAFLADAGTYYLKVEEYNNDDVINPYTLHVRVTSDPLFVQVINESEPNSVKSEADVIAATESSLVRRGSITDSVDRDYYSFQARAGDKVFVALDGDPDRDGVGNDFTLRFFHYDTESPPVLIATDSSGASTGLNSAGEAFSWNILTTGLYLVQVDLDSTEPLTAEGDYRLLVAGNSHPGSLQFGAATYSVSETDGSAAITVNRISGDEGPVTVHYAVTGGSASADSDYGMVGGILTFAHGETSKTIVIPIQADAYQEGSENLVLTLSQPTNGAILGIRTETVLTIQDSTTPPVMDVTPMVNVIRFKGKFNRHKRRVRQQVMLHNVSGQGLFGPLMLVLDGLSKKVKLRNRTGVTTTGSPYVMVNPGVLGANESISLMLNFRSLRRNVGYTPRVVAGIGAV